MEVAVSSRYRDAYSTASSNFVIDFDSLLNFHKIISKVTTRPAIFSWTVTFAFISFNSLPFA